MNDYNQAASAQVHPTERAFFERAAAEKQREAVYTSGSLLGASALNRSIGGNQRNGMAIACELLDRAKQLSAMTSDLANRIGGTVPEAGEMAAKLDRDPMSDLLTALASIETALIRTEANVSRALQSL